MLTAARPSQRVIVAVPALMVGALQAAGKLPRRYGEGNSIAHEPTLADCAALTWLVDWDESLHLSAYEDGLRPALGYAAYRDGYDHGGGQRAREIVLVAGTKRSVLRLLRVMRAGAREQGLRLIGTVDCANRRMLKTLQRMGGIETRYVIEDFGS